MVSSVEMKKHGLIILLVLALALPLCAQETDTLTLLERQKLEQKRSPMGALMRSVAFPGWGQFYNHKYVKSAVVFGAESFFIYKAVHWWRKTENQYDLVQSLAADQKAGPFSTYTSYRNRRNDYLWLVSLSVFISMFDAYVDAHLSGFDVDLTPEFEDESKSLSLKISYYF
ncbi:MAG: DUF5683 domain-containing protein [bacterium]